MTYDEENLFARILSGKVPAHKIFETEYSLAILDAFPCCPGHSLLLPKMKASDLDSFYAIASEDQILNVSRDVGRLCKMVKIGMAADAVNVMVNSGKASGQIIPHLHYHVIPRVHGDNLVKHPASAPSMISSEEGAKVLGQLSAAI